jgi:hypothetical protein
MRGDATNAGAWNRMKLFNLEYLAVYLVDMEAFQSHDFASAFRVCCQYADLQVTTCQNLNDVTSAR